MAIGPEIIELPLQMEDRPTDGALFFNDVVALGVVEAINFFKKTLVECVGSI
jgi:hypothetical protein